METENYNKIEFEGKTLGFIYASLFQFREQNPEWTTDISIICRNWGMSIILSVYHPQLTNIPPESLILKFPFEVSDELVYKNEITKTVSSFISTLLII